MRHGHTNDQIMAEETKWLHMERKWVIDFNAQVFPQ